MAALQLRFSPPELASKRFLPFKIPDCINPVRFSIQMMQNGASGQLTCVYSSNTSPRLYVKESSAPLDSGPKLLTDKLEDVIFNPWKRRYQVQIQSENHFRNLRDPEAPRDSYARALELMTTLQTSPLDYFVASGSVVFNYKPPEVGDFDSDYSADGGILLYPGTLTIDSPVSSPGAILEWMRGVERLLQ